VPRREKDDFERVSTDFEVHAFVPERSKGLDSSSSVFVLVGSSLKAYFSPIVKWLSLLTLNQPSGVRISVGESFCM
jgi:hypothetical protein